MAVYPDAGEAVIVRRARSTAEVDDVAVVSPDGGELACNESNFERATRRARVESRRYIVANRLHFMWVLTIGGVGLHGAEGRQRIMTMTAKLVRKLRTELGEEFAYWYSPELHPSGHGWHMNVLVGRRIDHALVKRVWMELGGGFEVRVSDWMRDQRLRGRPMLDQLRRAALYACKYAEKDWGDVVLAGGAHRC